MAKERIRFGLKTKNQTAINQHITQQIKERSMGYYTNMLTDTAVLKTVDGTDANGRPNIIALEEIDCKIEFKNALTVNSYGQEITSSGRLFTESVVKVDDIIETKSKAFKVVNVTPYYPLTETFCAINEVYFA